MPQLRTSLTPLQFCCFNNSGENQICLFLSYVLRTTILHIKPRFRRNIRLNIVAGPRGSIGLNEYINKSHIWFLKTNRLDKYIFLKSIFQVYSKLTASSTHIFVHFYNKPIHKKLSPNKTVPRRYLGNRSSYDFEKNRCSKSSKNDD